MERGRAPSLVPELISGKSFPLASGPHILVWKQEGLDRIGGLAPPFCEALSPLSSTAPNLAREPWLSSSITF